MWNQGPEILQNLEFQPISFQEQKHLVPSPEILEDSSIKNVDSASRNMNQTKSMPLTQGGSKDSIQAESAAKDEVEDPQIDDEQYSAPNDSAEDAYSKEEFDEANESKKTLEERKISQQATENNFGVARAFSNEI